MYVFCARVNVWLYSILFSQNKCVDFSCTLNDKLKSAFLSMESVIYSSETRGGLQ